MLDYALLRKNMVESQVRTNEVTDRRVLRAMLDTPREVFVPDDLKPLAYNGEGLLLSNSPGAEPRALPAPITTARLIQLADIEPTDRVLEIGCATGYGTALIARLAATVTALDSDPALIASAKAGLSAAGLTNDDVEIGPLPEGWPKGAPYDVIVVSGAIASLPDAYVKQLRQGGRMVAVIAEGPVGRAMYYERVGDGLARRYGFDVSAPMLPGFAKKPAFVL